MPPNPILITEDMAAAWTGRPRVTLRRWATEGRITRHPDPGRRRNGVRYDLNELPRQTVDELTDEVTLGPPPPLPHRAQHAA